MADTFSVRIRVRGYEVDTQGHLNMAVYLQYAEHARWECLRAAGLGQDELLAAGVGPVQLEVNIRYHRELRGGDEVDVSCGFETREGKTFLIRQDFHRPDGTLVAELTAVCGVLDLRERKLVPDPIAQLRKLIERPEMIGL